jgi:hypothetical protein
VVGPRSEPERHRRVGWDSSGVSQTDPSPIERRLMRFWWLYVAAGPFFLAWAGFHLWSRGPAWGVYAGFFTMWGLFVIINGLTLRWRRNQFAGPRLTDRHGN